MKRDGRNRAVPAHKAAFLAYLQMTVFLIPIIIVIVLSAFRYSLKTIQMEFQQINQNATENISATMEQFVREIRHISAFLIVDNSSQLFYSRMPLTLFPNAIDRQCSQVRAFCGALNYVDGIWMYSPGRQTAIGAYPQQNGSYLYSLDDLEPSLRSALNVEKGFSIIPRQRAARYPYVLTMAQNISYLGNDSIVAVDVSLQNLAETLSVVEDESHVFYILDGEGRVVYQSRKRALLPDAKDMSDLAPFRNNAESGSLLYEERGGQYVFSQVYNSRLNYYFIYKAGLREYTARVNAIKGLLFSAASVLFMLLLGMAVYFVRRMINPLRHLESALDKGEVMTGRKDAYTAYLVDRIMSQIHRNEEMKSMLTGQLALIEKTQLISLRSQLNPHFLFNTMNLLSMMVSEGGDPDHAVRMIERLSEMLRYSLDQGDVVTFSIELAQTKNYIRLLLLRYDDEFDVAFDIAQGLEACSVPKLFLQPLIENAVFHGVTPLESRRGQIVIRAIREGAFLKVTVTDNGIGMAREKAEEMQARLNETQKSLPEKHLGVLNAAMRLQLLFPDAPPIRIESVQGEMTRLTIMIPQ